LVNEQVRLEREGEAGGAHFLIFVCQVDAEEGEAQEQAEGALAWFTRDDIDYLHSNGRIIPSDYAMLSKFVDGEPISHFEVEMDSYQGEHGGSGPAKLTRFEKVS
jgi:hypothetical protein